MSYKEQLEDAYENWDEWQRSKLIEFENIELVKLSGKLKLAINPLDEEGKKMKKRDLFIRSLDELIEFREILNNETLDEIIKQMDHINSEE